MLDKTKFQDKKEWQKFALGLAIILWIFATLQLIFGKSFYPYFYIAGLGVFLAGLFWPKLIKPVFILFSYIGFILNWFFTQLILTFFFYFLFFPFSFLLKITDKDFLDLKKKKSANTYWRKRETVEFKKDYYEQQF